MEILRIGEEVENNEKWWNMIKKSKSKLVKKDGMELVNLVGKIGEHILNRTMPDMCM